MTETVDLLDKGEKAGIKSVVIIFAIGIAKGVIGYISGSISLIAQAVDSVKDIFSLVAVILGLRISKREPSERFTYGYYKIETIVSLIISILILVTGGEILRESINQILNPTQLNSPYMAVGVAALSIPLLYWNYKTTKKVADEINSQSLKNQASDFMVDIYSSALVLVGVVTSIIGFPSVEGLAGSVISLLTIKMGLSLTWESLLGLMDAVENPERIIKIKDIAESVNGVSEAYSIRLRNTGPFCMGELSIGVDEALPVDQAHRLSEKVEEKIKSAMPAIESITVHIEPKEATSLLLAMPIEEDRGIGSNVSMHLVDAPFFLFVRIDDGEIDRWFSKDNPSRDLERKKGITLADMLIEEEVNTLLAPHISSVVFHVLRDHFIHVYRLELQDTARNIVSTFLSDELEMITEVTVDKEGHKREKE
ncbi:cation diffusion facilitator family transporter [Candidatus Bathyarchaeota archaeon]|nr:cation diffusion facilitator family transporter [Candidatus Bathyarchaeota archaeon]